MAFTNIVTGTVSSELISSGVQNVYSGGIAVSCAIINGGWQYLFDGGVASYTEVDPSGRQIVSSGGTAFYTLINYNGAQLVEGAASGAIITSGGYQGVGGTADTVIISSGGMQFIQSHGIANSTLISSGGSQFINSAGSAINTNISGGNQIIGSGGVAVLTALSNNGQQNIYAGGTANSTLISSGAAQHVSGTANSTIVYSGGLQLVEYGGTANFTAVSSGGNQSIISGGTASSSLIDFCGNQMVESGGTANYTAIASGGAQNIQSQGVANATIISSGGTQTVSAGGTANNTYNYGRQEILSGGVASNAVVGSGGDMYIFSGGNFSGSIIIDGGHVTVDHPGDFNPSAVNIKLANAQANDAIMTIQANVDNVNGTLLAVDVSNAKTGLYILSYGTNLTGMNGATFAVKDGAQTVTLRVGSSYTFGDGDKLALGFTDGVTDKVTASFSVKGEVLDLTAPTVPTGLQATLTGNTLGLTWNDSTDAGGIKQYELWGDEYSDFSSPLSNGYHKFVSETKDAIPNMEAGVYYMKIRAQDNAGNWSGWSTSVSTTVFGTLAVNSTAKGYVGSTDFYKLTLDKTGILNLSLTGLTANADLALLTATGTVLKTSANIGNSNETINGVMLTAGNYYVKVGPSGKIDTDYMLGNTFNALPTDTAANDYMTAKDINAGVDNWVGFGDAADFYKLTMTNAGTLALGITGLTGDADLSLLNSSGTLIKSNVKAGTASEGMSDVGLLAGTYYVKVAAAAGVNDAGYTLIHLEKYTPVDTAANTWQTAKDINAGVDNWVGFGDAADFYKLTLSGAGALTLGLTGLTGDADLSLLNSSGIVLKSNIKTGIASEGISGFALQAGTYYVKVAAAAGVNDANYILSSSVGDNTPPGAPAGLTMTYTGATVEFDWNDSTDPSGIKQYEVMADEYADFSSPQGYHNTVTESKDSVAMSEQAGSFFGKVRVQDNTGNWSVWSSTAYLTVIGTLAVNSSAKDSVGSTDVYKLTLDNAGILNLSLTGLSGNADLSLCNAAGTVLKTSANTGTNPEAINNVTLLAGTYYVKVIPSGKIGTDYTVSNTFKAFPVDTAANDYMTAKDINAGVDNWVGFGDAADFYKLTMTNAGTLSVGITGLTGNADLSLLSSTGTVLKSNIKTGTESEGISGIALLAGTYYVKVAAATGVNDANYTLTHLEKCCPTDTGANTWQTAKNIDDGVDNWVGFGDAADFYKLTMTNAGTMTLGLTGLTGNADLSLLSSTGTVLKSNFKTGTDSEGISGIALLAGTYYVKVAAATGVNDATYTLTHLEKCCPTDTGANTWQTAKNIDDGVDNWVGFGDAADFYKLTMTNAGTLSVGITGLTGDADLSLLNSAGTVLKSNFKTGTASEGISDIALLAGTYYVKVAAATGVNDAGYTLTHLEKYTPADTGANTWQTAKNIDDGVDNWVGFGDAADFYKLIMTNAGALSVGITGLTGNADLSLLNSAGTVLKSNIKAGTDSEGISDIALLAGTYYVKVAAATGVNDASYTLINLINYFPGDTYDKAGNTSATAKLVDGPTQTGWVGLGDSDDLYKFTFDVSAQGTIRLYGLNGGNADLTLYNSNGTLLKKSSNLGILEDTVTSTLSAGTYYAKVNAVSGSSIDYKLDFTKNNLGMLAS